MPGFKNIWYLGTKKMKFNEWRWKVLNLLIHNHIQAGAANSWWQDSGFWGLPAKHEWGTQRTPLLRECCDPGLQFPQWQSRGFWKIHSSIKAMQTLPKSDQNQYFHNSGNYLVLQQPEKHLFRKNGWISSKTVHFVAFQLILFPSASHIFI